MKYATMRNRYTTFFFLAVLAVPVVSLLRGRIAGTAVDFADGILIGLALVFLAAAARNRAAS